MVEQKSVLRFFTKWELQIPAQKAAQGSPTEQASLRVWQPGVGRMWPGTRASGMEQWMEKLLFLCTSATQVLL